METWNARGHVPVPLSTHSPRAQTFRVVNHRLALLLAASMLLFAAACDGATSREGDESFLSEGDRAPEFRLPSASGEEVALTDFTNHKPVLLYFSMGPG